MKRIRKWCDKHLANIWGLLMLMIITIGLIGVLMKLTLWVIGMGGMLI